VSWRVALTHVFAVVVWLWLSPSHAREVDFPDAEEKAGALRALMALPQSASSAARIVATDQRRGYYEGWTHHWRRGVGYRIGDVSLIDGFASQVDSRWLPRAEALQDSILPHGHEARYPQASESLWLHRGDTAISLVLRSDQAQRLGLLPLWSLPAEAVHAEQQEDGLWLLQLPAQEDARVPTVVAISANHLIDWLPLSDAALPEALRQPARYRALLQTRDRQTELQVHLVFDRDRHAALRRARDLVAQDVPAQLLRSAWRDLSAGVLWTSDAEFNRALLWSQWSALGFVVDEFGPGIWAGLPWFRDNWGRDTFIALPGTLLSSGQFDAAQAVIDAFVARQRTDPADENEGRIPNRVAAHTETLYNTVDGTPWLIIAAWRLAQHTGRWDRMLAMRPMMARYIAGAVRHHVDADGLLTHDDADTWMDARIEGREAWSPRGNRAVEVQALWYAALQIAARVERKAGDIEQAAQYEHLAARARIAFRARFWDGQKLADRVTVDGRADFRWRPNVLLAVALQDDDLGLPPLLSVDEQARVVGDAFRHLAYPWGLASLDPQDEDFHPRHVNDAFHHKDAAYHNGTVWVWNTGFAISALARLGATEALSRWLGELTTQVLDMDPPGSLSELVDAWPDRAGRVSPSGTFSQSWSVAEFTRSSINDVVGYQPQLLEDRVLFRPSLPRTWSHIAAKLPIGEGRFIALTIRQRAATQTWHVQTSHRLAKPWRLRWELRAADGSLRRVEVEWRGEPLRMQWADDTAHINGERWHSDTVEPSVRSELGELRFLSAPPYRDGLHPVTRGKDVLRRRIRQADPSEGR
jgi:glycogen debranching enzyme